MLKQDDYCVDHPQYPISMISLNTKIFPQRKICCKCVTSCNAQNDLKQNELMTLEEFYQKLEEQKNKISGIQQKKQQVFESISQILKQCQTILNENQFDFIQREVEKLIQQGPRSLSNNELKMFSNILIHDFQRNYKMMDMFKNNFDSASNQILKIFTQFKDANSIQIQVNIRGYKEFNVSLPIHKKINDLIREFGKEDDQLYVNGEEIKNLDTTLFENNICSNDTLYLQNYIKQMDFRGINIKLIDKQFQTFEFGLQSSETILTVKQYVQQKEGIDPSQQKIIYHGRVLQDFEKLEHLNAFSYKFMQQDINQFVMLLDINKTVINIFNIDEKPPFIKMNPKFNFANIIHEIQYHFDIPYKMISSILINNCPLQQNQQIQNLLKSNTSPFELTVKLSRPTILAKTLSGKIIIINSQEFETIQNIKQQIQDNYNIPISHQYIYHKNNIIGNSKSLSEIGIKQIDMLNIKCQLDEKLIQEFDIQIVDFYGRTSSIKIKPFQNVFNSDYFLIDSYLNNISSFFIKGIRVRLDQCYSDFNMKKNDKIIKSIIFASCSK